jgi:hypothetical protein
VRLPEDRRRVALRVLAEEPHATRQPQLADERLERRDEASGHE